MAEPMASPAFSNPGTGTYGGPVDPGQQQSGAGSPQFSQASHQFDQQPDQPGAPPGSDDSPNASPAGVAPAPAAPGSQAWYAAQAQQQQQQPPNPHGAAAYPPPQRTQQGGFSTAAPGSAGAPAVHGSPYQAQGQPQPHRPQEQGFGGMPALSAAARSEQPAGAPASPAAAAAAASAQQPASPPPPPPPPSPEDIAAGKIQKAWRKHEDRTKCTRCHRADRLAGVDICDRCSLDTIRHYEQNIMPRLHQSGSTIRFYNRHDPFYEFTNFYPIEMDWHGHTCYFSESAFQLEKFRTTAPKVAKAIAAVGRPREGFDLAHRFYKQERKDWLEVREQVMLEVLRIKFANIHMRRLLELTSDMTLIEHSPVDKTWGNGGNDTGKNKLGEMLMRVRWELMFNDGKPLETEQEVDKVTGRTVSGPFRFPNDDIEKNYELVTESAIKLWEAIFPGQDHGMGKTKQEIAQAGYFMHRRPVFPEPVGNEFYRTINACFHRSAVERAQPLVDALMNMMTIPNQYADNVLRATEVLSFIAKHSIPVRAADFKGGVYDHGLGKTKEEIARNAFYLDKTPTKPPSTPPQQQAPLSGWNGGHHGHHHQRGSGGRRPPSPKRPVVRSPFDDLAADIETLLFRDAFEHRSVTDDSLKQVAASLEASMDLTTCKETLKMYRQVNPDIELLHLGQTEDQVAVSIFFFEKRPPYDPALGGKIATTFQWGFRIGLNEKQKDEVTSALKTMADDAAAARTKAKIEGTFDPDWVKKMNAANKPPGGCCSCCCIQ